MEKIKIIKLKEKDFEREFVTHYEIAAARLGNWEVLIEWYNRQTNWSFTNDKLDIESEYIGSPMKTEKEKLDDLKKCAKEFNAYREICIEEFIGKDTTIEKD